MVEARNGSIVYDQCLAKHARQGDAAVVFGLCIPEQMSQHLGKELLNLSDHVSAK